MRGYDGSLFVRPRFLVSPFLFLTSSSKVRHILTTQANRRIISYVFAVGSYVKTTRADIQCISIVVLESTTVERTEYFSYIVIRDFSVIDDDESRREEI